MSPDFLDLLRAFSDAEARFLVIGAYAVGVHGRPRATKDLDVWVEASTENAPRVMRGLVAFGAPLMGLTESDLSTPGLGLQIGIAPGRIDVLTKISGEAADSAATDHSQTAVPAALATLRRAGSAWTSIASQVQAM
jgi:hypothetical protein